MKRILLYCLVILFIPGQSCKKDNAVSIHCDGLVNDPLPAGDQGQIYVATAFSPNGDGINDLFKPYGVQINEIKVRVYDKNSNLVFQTDQMGVGWNPPPVTHNETYYFRVEATTLTNTKIGRCGEVKALLCSPAGGSNQYSFEDQLTPFGFTGVTQETLANCN